MPKPIDTSLANCGVVASLKVTGDGKYRLTLDDVSRLMTLDAEAWRHECLFTYKDFDIARLDNLDLTKDELAQIGENLIIRLLALRNGKSSRGGYNVT